MFIVEDRIDENAFAHNCDDDNDVNCECSPYIVSEQTGGSCNRWGETQTRPRHQKPDTELSIIMAISVIFNNLMMMTIFCTRCVEFKYTKSGKLR